MKHTIIDMSLNASGIRDTARVLRISTDTVLRDLKKKKHVGVGEHRSAAHAEPRRGGGGYDTSG